MRFALILAGLISFAYCTESQPKKNLKNLIRNGDFSKNSLPPGKKWVIASTLPEWQLPKQVEYGMGSVYNRRWEDKIVIELDSNQNDILRQVLDLEAGKYILSVDYAARTGQVSTSEMRVSWNGDIVKTISGKDQEIHTLQLPLTAKTGKNTLEIYGEGKSDSLGMTMTNVRIVKAQAQPPVQIAVSQPKKNLIRNGDFSKNSLPPGKKWVITSTLPEWQLPKQAEQGIGNVYNSRWGNKVVIELDSNQNDILRQVLDLQAGKYNFSLDYAARSGQVSTSAMSVFWNGDLIKTIQGKDQEIHTLQLPFTAIAGKNTLQIRGVGKSDRLGMTVTNLRLFKAPVQKPIQSLTSTLALKPAPVVVVNSNLLSNGGFDNPPMLQGRDWITDLTGWDVKRVQHGVGNLWNKRWGTRNVIELDQDLNNWLKQSIDLSVGKYKFQIEHAASEESMTNPVFSVWLNGKKILKKTVGDKGIHTATYYFSVESTGSFNFQIRNEKSNGHLTVGKVSVSLITPSDYVAGKLPCSDPIQEE